LKKSAARWGSARPLFTTGRRNTEVWGCRSYGGCGNWKKYLEVAKAMNIPAKTAEGYITNFVKSGLIHREAHDQYINTSLEESKDSKEI